MTARLCPKALLDPSIDQRHAVDPEPCGLYTPCVNAMVFSHECREEDRCGMERARRDDFVIRLHIHAYIHSSRNQ